MFVSRRNVLLAARLAHSYNELWRKAHGEYPHGPWENLSDEKKESAINGVETCLQLQMKGHFSLYTLCEAMHDNWMEYKVNKGWVFGEAQSEEAKTHPCLVPFRELPEFQKEKDSFIPRAIEFVGLMQCLDLE